MRAQLENRRLVSSHWGVYEALAEHRTADAHALRALPEDPDPSPIGLAMLDALRSRTRVQRPSIRKGWLEAFRRGELEGRGAGRGREPFVEVSWDEAIEIVAAELLRVRERHGNASIFGGSYGWSSAGRFHHAQSQVHRFLNSIGGYVRHADSYSLGAARVLMPHVVAPMDELMANHHGWDVLAEHTRLFVSFGGVPAKNAQVAAGGASQHHARQGLARMAAAGCRFVNFSPVKADLDVDPQALEWIPIRPNTDTAVMLALATETILAGRHDEAFLASHCTGFERWRDYLLGKLDHVVKNAEWASRLSGVPAERIRKLAAEMAAQRSLVNVAWSLQRADHGEQPYWAAVGLAAVLGQIGLPGGGFGVAYGPVNLVGSPHRHFSGPTLSQGRNAVEDFIPVARIADLLLSPGEPFTYNGKTHRYADIRLVYWAGGNPFHHHQDLNRLARAWRRPETVITHEQAWTSAAKMADIVLPATTTLEREDIGFSNRDPLLIALKPVSTPPGEARDDYSIFADIAARLGASEVFTEGLGVREWLVRMYEESVPRAAAAGIELPPFEAFWEAGSVRLPDPDKPVVMLEAFRRDPQAAPLRTPSGRVELFSERIAGFELPDCAGHPAWYEPGEWLGAAPELLARHPLHLISDQPVTRLHSQLDFSSHSRGAKIAGREPVWINPADAAARSIVDGDIVRVFNGRGACLAGAIVTEAMAPRVVKLSTGAWWDPLDPTEDKSLDKHGNPNVLTRDVPASGLSQGCAAQSCLVEVERFDGELPPITAFEPPQLLADREVR
jgi:biotin/methionine sulfoxide reductase